jgi:hypothetical protein
VADLGFASVGVDVQISRDARIYGASCASGLNLPTYIGLDDSDLDRVAQPIGDARR